MKITVMTTDEQIVTLEVDRDESVISANVLNPRHWLAKYIYYSFLVFCEGLVILFSPFLNAFLTGWKLESSAWSWGWMIFFLFFFLYFVLLLDIFVTLDLKLCAIQCIRTDAGAAAATAVAILWKGNEEFWEIGCSRCYWWRFGYDGSERGGVVWFTVCFMNLQPSISENS